jgi:glycosyl transferase family 25
MININNIKSYIINLEKDKTKYDLCLKRLQKINLNLPERFDAIYVKDEYDDYIKSITYPSVQYTIKYGRNAHNNIGSKGAIGCYLSHIALWKKLLESDQEMFLIFEDDVDINNNIDNLMVKTNDYINTINKKDWDVIFLGYSLISLLNNDIPEDINDKYKITNIIYGLHAYIINKKGARKLLEKALPIVDQLDSYMSYMAIMRDVNMYKPTEILFIQNNIKTSTIQTDMSIKPFITQFNNHIISSIIMFFILFLLLITCICVK